jgi:hypothetical protein
MTKIKLSAVLAFLFGLILLATPMRAEEVNTKSRQHEVQVANLIDELVDPVVENQSQVPKLKLAHHCANNGMVQCWANGQEWCCSEGQSCHWDGGSGMGCY